MSWNGSANVKHSEAMSDGIVTAMSTACGASIFLFESFKKNLESICCPSYETLISFMGERKRKKKHVGGKKEKKKIRAFATPRLELSPFTVS